MGSVAYFLCGFFILGPITSRGMHIVHLTLYTLGSFAYFLCVFFSLGPITSRGMHIVHLTFYTLSSFAYFLCGFFILGPITSRCIHKVHLTFYTLASSAPLTLHFCSIASALDSSVDYVIHCPCTGSFSLCIDLPHVEFPVLCMPWGFAMRARVFYDAS